jgi:hypothetical protein
MSPIVYDEHKKICLGCNIPLGGIAHPRVSALSTLWQRYPLCFVCKRKESQAINHMVWNYRPEDVVVFQRLMVDGYKKRWVKSQLFYLKPGDDMVEFMDRFAAPVHTMQTWGSVH